MFQQSNSALTRPKYGTYNKVLSSLSTSEGYNSLGVTSSYFNYQMVPFLIGKYLTKNYF